MAAETKVESGNGSSATDLGVADLGMTAMFWNNQIAGFFVTGFTKCGLAICNEL